MTTTRTQVHLVRHGEVHNPDRILYGRLPGYRLSELGQEMARVVAADRVGQVVGARVSCTARVQPRGEHGGDREGAHAGSVGRRGHVGGCG